MNVAPCNSLDEFVGYYHSIIFISLCKVGGGHPNFGYWASKEYLRKLCPCYLSEQHLTETLSLLVIFKLTIFGSICWNNNIFTLETQTTNLIEMSRLLDQ